MTRKSLVSLQNDFAFLGLQMHSIAILLVATAGCRSFVDRYRPIQVTEHWAGVFPEKDVHKIKERIFLIQDSESWEYVWQTWSDGEAPQVDFQRESIVAVRGEGPNELMVSELSKSRDRDLRVSTITTFMGGRSGCYLLLRIPKTDVESINGEPISELHIADDD